MAESVMAMSDLKKAFGHFLQMSDLATDLSQRIDDINKKNKDSAGSGDIGQQYHNQVDDPTKGLTELVNVITRTLTDAGITGSGVADVFNEVEEHNSTIAGSW